jgi:hypothetical protein
MVGARTGAAGVLLSLLLAGCASPVQVAPASLVPLSAPAADFLVDSDVPIRLSTGYTRTLPAQSRWRAIGSLPQGTVYQPVNTVFAVEGRQVHEAYLVMQGKALQGFYLPGEGNFSPLAPPQTLPTTQGGKR